MIYLDSNVCTTLFQLACSLLMALPSSAFIIAMKLLKLFSLNSSAAICTKSVIILALPERSLRDRMEVAEEEQSYNLFMWQCATTIYWFP